MKRIIILTVLIAYTSIRGCDKDTEGVSKITSYPEIGLEKGPLIAIDLGTSYT